MVAHFCYVNTATLLANQRPILSAWWGRFTGWADEPLHRLGRRAASPAEQTSRFAGRADERVTRRRESGPRAWPAQGLRHSAWCMVLAAGSALASGAGERRWREAGAGEHVHGQRTGAAPRANAATFTMDAHDARCARREIHDASSELRASTARARAPPRKWAWPRAPPPSRLGTAHGTAASPPAPCPARGAR